jgi:hypothetical protein
MIIRSVKAEDRRTWEPLWRGYLEFYRAALTPDVTEWTWAALVDPTSAVHGLVAEQDGELVGLAHLILHPTTWATPDEAGAAKVYWLTQEYNAPARSLYDTLGHRTSFVVYER